MIGKIAVVGAGNMGQGIARSVAAAGIEVILKDINDERIKEALDSLKEKLDFEIERWALTKSEKAAILSRIKGTKSYEDLYDTELVVESVPEEKDLKLKVFAEMDYFFDPHVILASNTSTLSITELGSVTKRPDKVVGMHFLNPPHRRKLVEVVKGLHTSNETVNVVKEFLGHVGKESIEVFENPGEVTTRLSLAFIAEAMTMVMESIASIEDIDKSMRMGFDFPMGPLELADRIGLDEVEKRMKHLFEELGDVKYRPNVLLRKLVRAGRLGVKSEKGFFSYTPEGRRIDAEEEHI